jgi:rubredoxin
MDLPPHKGPLAAADPLIKHESKCPACNVAFKVYNYTTTIPEKWGDAPVHYHCAVPVSVWLEHWKGDGYPLGLYPELDDAARCSPAAEEFFKALARWMVRLDHERMEHIRSAPLHHDEPVPTVSHPVIFNELPDQWYCAICAPAGMSETAVVEFAYAARPKMERKRPKRNPGSADQWEPFERSPTQYGGDRKTAMRCSHDRKRVHWYLGRPMPSVIMTWGQPDEPKKSRRRSRGRVAE